MVDIVSYKALNGSRKIENLSKQCWSRINGSGGTCYAKQHCGGILALLVSAGEAIEITEAELRERLGNRRLPWE